MKSSYRLFTTKGIDVRIHLSLLILLLLPATQVAHEGGLGEGLLAALQSFLFFIILFASVLAHELSHSLVALRNGVNVKEIILWPLGGIASMGMVSEPLKEFKISIAGPLMSLCLGILLFAGLLAIGGTEATYEGLVSSDFMKTPSLFNFVLMAAYINIILGIFNLFLPIFPMDGGRVLRSLLASFMDKVRATKIALLIGHGFLAALITLAIIIGNLWLIFIAVFLFIAGLAELRMVEMSALAEGLDFRKLVKGNIMAVSPDLGMDDFRSIELPQQGVYPVLGKDYELLGVLDSRRLKGASVKESMGKDTPILDLGGNREEIISMIMGRGYGLVVEEGKFAGAIVSKDLERELNKLNKRRRG
jgi:Zn-dependent protease